VSDCASSPQVRHVASLTVDVYSCTQIAADVDMDELAKRTEGYSGDDLTNISRDASMNGIRRRIAGRRLTPEEIKNMSKEDMSDPVSMKDFDEALAKIQPSVSHVDIERHEKWLAEFGSS
jgi:katanin p60 ATPase-containing subunit A1